MTDLSPDGLHAFERLTIRRARADESEMAYRIKRDALQAHPAIGDGWDEAEQWQAHKRRFAAQDYYLLEEDGTAVGVMALVIGPEQIRFNQFCVLRSHHGKGIGTAALRVLAAEADMRSLPIRLDVMPNNHRAIALYEKFGFGRVEGTAERVAMVRLCGRS